jgi:hypothetical protein
MNTNKAYAIYMHHHNPTRAIRIGWSWGGFLFGWLWGVYHGLWVQIITHLGLFFAIILFTPVRELHIGDVTLIHNIIGGLIWGIKGNEFRVSKLLSKGYTWNKDIYANNQYEALEAHYNAILDKVK